MADHLQTELALAAAALRRSNLLFTLIESALEAGNHSQVTELAALGGEITFAACHRANRGTEARHD